MHCGIFTLHARKREKLLHSNTIATRASRPGGVDPQAYLQIDATSEVSPRLEREK